VNESLNLDPVARITAGAVGEPGHRTFYLQARRDDVLVSLVVEKSQVEFLTRHVEALLARLTQTHPREEAVVADEASLELEEPVEPRFRVGAMALGFDAERDLILLQCEELVVTEGDDEEGAEAPEARTEAEAADPIEAELESILEAESGATVRLWATREQMRAMARHGARVTAAGRPRCRLCGQPMDPEGHVCPGLNGHRELPDLG
jgi:uncharacterized repeat protein (TIGR03847 family)